MSRVPQVKNRAPAPIQITAEQIIRGAKERQLEDVPKAPKQFITDAEELQEYRLHKRKEFEDSIRRQRHHIGTWIKYALWEAGQKEYERMRSVFERALDVDHREQSLWLKYADTEMKNKFVNHARNVWDRAVTYHPRVDQFWYRYTLMEEIVGNIEGTRQLFERWMKWEPDDNAWFAYVKFEMRQGEIGRARGVYERYIELHVTCRAYLKYARFEEKQHQKAFARQIYERAMLELPDEEKSTNLYVQFARFEERCNEFERARVIYKYALGQVPKEENPELYQEFISFEKKHGSRQGIEEVIYDRRKAEYEKAIEADQYDYDSWFDYIRLEEAEGDLERIRDVYERAIACVPPVREKRYWRRYIYLWINYALFEELQAKDMDRTRQVYKQCVQRLNEETFTFGKIWLMWAHFEVRQFQVDAARKVLGWAIGSTKKKNVFKGYVELEMSLGEVTRARKLYEKYAEEHPQVCSVWTGFAQLETMLKNNDRARAVYELAIAQPMLDMPEVLWKAYIDFEITLQEWQRVRELYERLLERTTHVKVWTSYAKFELTHEGGGLEDARAVYQRGYVVLKREDLKEERVLLLQEWLEAERSTEAGQPDDVVLKMPKKVKMKRMVPERGGMEEYYEWQFPDDVVKLPGLKLLEQAMLWKRKQAEANAAPSQTETREDAANEESGGAADEESDGAADEESDGAADEESDGIAKRRRVDEQCEE